MYRDISAQAERVPEGARRGRNRILLARERARLTDDYGTPPFALNQRKEFVGKPRGIREEVMREAHRPCLVREGEPDLLAPIIHTEISHRVYAITREESLEGWQRGL